MSGRNPHQDANSQSHNSSVDPIHSIQTSTKKSSFVRSLFAFKNFTFLPTNSAYVASSHDPMPLFRKKKKTNNQREQERRSTRTFRVRTDLQLAEGAAAPSAVQEEEDTVSRATALKDRPNPHTPATSISESSSDTSSSPVRRQPYYRGGGYCSHVGRSYEERWSQEHVEMVLKSWKMTERQRDKLMELKERVKDVDHFLLNDPHQLVYFLLDERGNVELAEKWFRKVTKDRKESPHQHDTLCEDYELPDDFDYFPIGILEGCDRDGDAIHITRTGAADCWGLYQRHGRENLVRHAIYYQELDARGAWIDDYEQKMGRKVTQYTVIFDLEGLSMRHIKPGLIPVLSYCSRLMQDTYPELVKRVLIVRAPAVFKFIWGLTKHFFDAELRELMIFASGDANSREVLEQYIDPDVLPHCLHSGGKDGRLARGYEHIIMEGGMLPPEGTYTTPQHCKEGRTRAEEEEYIARQRQRRATSISDSSSLAPSPATAPYQPYCKGGGYCSHVGRSYEERWSREHVEMVTNSWKMTKQQCNKLMDLKERVMDVDHFLLNDPHQLAYFLFAEGDDVTLAEEWFREVAKNRKESPHQHDTICRDYELPDDYDYFPIGILEGYDRDGDAIQITRTGAADCWGLYQRHGRENLVHHAIYYQELMTRGAWIDDYEQKMGKKVTQYTLIVDLKGLSLRHIRPGLLPVLSYCSRLIQDTYPALVKQVLIVRAPGVFKFIWGLCKHFFDPELRDLMIFASGDANSQEVLEKYIDPDVLPHCVHIGGKDGRMARGYEHIIVEGGMLPPEGSYTTPQHCKEGRTRAEEEEYVARQMCATARTSNSRLELERAFSDSGMGETMQTSNTRRGNSLRKKKNTTSEVSCHCTNLFGGSYNPIPTDDPEEDYKVLINITSGNRHLVGLN